jgi:hypothetical protein
MPAHYVIDLENRIVLTIFRGILTLEDVMKQRERLNHDPAFNPEFSEVVDFNAVSEFEMDYAAFGSILEVDPFSITSKHALVVDSLNSVYGVAGMYRVMRSYEIRVKIFKTIQETVKWLAEE